jgi:hypothetical protein
MQQKPEPQYFRSGLSSLSLILIKTAQLWKYLSKKDTICAQEALEWASDLKTLT